MGTPWWNDNQPQCRAEVLEGPVGNQSYTIWVRSWCFCGTEGRKGLKGSGIIWQNQMWARKILWFSEQFVPRAELVFRCRILFSAIGLDFPWVVMVFPQVVLVFARFPRHCVGLSEICLVFPRSRQARNPKQMVPNRLFWFKPNKTVWNHFSGLGKS